MATRHKVQNYFKNKSSFTSDKSVPHCLEYRCVVVVVGPEFTRNDVNSIQSALQKSPNPTRSTPSRRHGGVHFRQANDILVVSESIWCQPFLSPKVGGVKGRGGGGVNARTNPCKTTSTSFGKLLGPPEMEEIVVSGMELTSNMVGAPPVWYISAAVVSPMHLQLLFKLWHTGF